MSDPIKDDGKTIIKCRACMRPLVTIWHTRARALDPRTGKPFAWKLQANCCYCNNNSYITEVTGGFHIGGYGIDINEDVNVEKTSIINHNYEEDINGVIQIKTAKFKSD